MSVRANASIAGDNHQGISCQVDPRSEQKKPSIQTSEPISSSQCASKKSDQTGRFMGKAQGKRTSMHPASVHPYHLPKKDKPQTCQVRSPSQMDCSPAPMPSVPQKPQDGSKAGTVKQGLSRSTSTSEKVQVPVNISKAASISPPSTKAAYPTLVQSKDGVIHVIRPDNANPVPVNISKAASISPPSTKAAYPTLVQSKDGVIHVIRPDNANPGDFVSQRTASLNYQLKRGTKELSHTQCALLKVSAIGDIINHNVNRIRAVMEMQRKVGELCTKIHSAHSMMPVNDKGLTESKKPRTEGQPHQDKLAKVEVAASAVKQSQSEAQKESVPSATVTNSNEALTQEVEKLRKENEQLEKRLSVRERISSELKLTLLAEHQKTKSYLTQTFASKEIQFHNVHFELCQKLAAMRREMEQSQRTITDLQSTINNPEKGNQQKKILKLEQTISELKLKLESTDTENQLQLTVQRTKAELEKVTKQAHYAESQHEAQMKEAMRSLRKTEEERDRLRDQLMESQTEHDVHRLYEATRLMERVTEQTLQKKSDSQRQATRDKFRDVYKRDLCSSLWCESRPLADTLVGIRIKEEALTSQIRAQTLPASTSQDGTQTSQDAVTPSEPPSQTPLVPSNKPGTPPLTSASWTVESLRKPGLGLRFARDIVAEDKAKVSPEQMEQTHVRDE